MEQEQSGKETHAAPSPKNKVKRIVALAILVALAFFGVRYYLNSRNFEKTDDAFLEGRIVAVSSKVPGHITKVLVTDNQEVQAGDLLVELDSRDFEVQLEKARAALKVAEARAGASESRVALTRITSGSEADVASSGVLRAEAYAETVRFQTEAARIRIEQAGAGREAAEAMLAQAEAEIKVGEADKAQAEADLARYQSMDKRGIITRQQLEQAETALKVASARLESGQKKAATSKSLLQQAIAAERSAEEGLKQAAAQYTEAEAAVKQSKERYSGAQGGSQQVAAVRSDALALTAEIEQAKAAVKQAELNLSYTRIYAPQSGRVTKKLAEAGNFVQTGQSLLAIVQKDLWVVANFKETQLDRMRPGQPAEITIDAYPGRKYKAHVESIQTGTGARFSLLPPENATGNYVKVVQRLPVKIVFDEPLPASLPVGPGMSVLPVVDIR